MKLALCTYSHGPGNGIAKMDAQLMQHLDRRAVQPLLVYINSNTSKQYVRHSQESLEVSLDCALEHLVPLFSEVDVVQFNGSYDPVVSPAAEIACKPILVEVMHNQETGQMHQRIDMTVCVSKKVQSQQFYPDKTCVILNGIDLDRFPYCSRSKNLQNVVLLQPARKSKRMHLSLEELAGEVHEVFPNVSLWLAGKGFSPPTSGTSPPGVHFLGLRKDMPELYQQADFMVMYSVRDSYGLVVAEAMATGCLPLITKDSGATDFVVHGENGYIADPASRQSMLDTVLTAISRRGDDFRMRLTARKTAAVSLDIKRAVKHYQALHEVLVKRGRAKGWKRPAAPEALTRMESNFLVAALLFTHATYKKRAFQLFQEISKSGIAFELRRVNHPFWQNAFMVAAKAAQELAATGDMKQAESIYRFMFMNNVVFPEYLRHWQRMGAPADLAGAIERQLQHFQAQ